MLEKRIMTMNVLINAQRNSLEIARFKTEFDTPESDALAQFQKRLNSIIQELSDELEL